MDEPEPLSNPSRDALAAFGSATDAPLTQGQRATVWKAAVGAPRRPPLLLVLAVSAALSFGVATALFRSRPPEVVAEPRAQWTRTGEVVAVRAGQVRVRPRQATTVRTPQLQATLLDAAALFDVTPAGTVLSVEQGEVAWRTRSRQGVLTAGQQVTIPAAPKVVLPVEAAAPPVEGCGAGAGLEACLAQRAEGSGLAAEFALYAQAMAARDRGAFAESAALFARYAERFPAGTFGPEASIARMGALLRAGQPDDARAEAAAFGQKFADDPRAADVAQWREEIP